MTPKTQRTAIAMACVTLMMGAAWLGACAPAASQAPPGAGEVEQVQADAPVLRVSFIASFRSSHALGQAQALEGAGRHDEAQALAAAALRDDAALHGLCFDRFTLGGAEIVLSACTPLSLEDSFVTQRRWLQHLGTTPGIIYVERNMVARHEDEAEAVPL